MRTKLVVLIIAALLVPAGAASAAFVTGKYRGKTSQQGPVSFTVTKKAVKKFTVGLVYSCTDGDRFQSTEGPFPPLKLSRKGKFAAGFKSNDGVAEGAILGRINRRTGKGSVVAQVKFDENNNPNPNGNVICLSSVTFKATRR